MENENIEVTNQAADTLDPNEQTQEQRIPYDRFKQKVDEANELKRKLAEIESAQAEAERKKLEEQNEFKSLYEQAQAEIERVKAEAQAVAINAKKDSLLTKAGYSEEQIAVLRNTVAGNTDEELAQAVASLSAVIAPKQTYIHQTPLGGGNTKPPQNDPVSFGRDLFDRVKNIKK